MWNFFFSWSSSSSRRFTWDWYLEQDSSNLKEERKGIMIKILQRYELFYSTGGESVLLADAVLIARPLFLQLLLEFSHPVGETFACFYEVILTMVRHIGTVLHLCRSLLTLP